MLCLLVLWVSFPTKAAEGDDAVVPECKVEADYLDQAAATARPRDKNESFSCFRAVDEIPPDHFLIVDVRPSDLYRKAHIPGSVNLSPDQLMNTAALQKRRVLVVDQGFSRTRMAELCARAGDHHFDNLTVLAGGVAAWSAAGARMQGDPGAIARLPEIEADAFFTELARQRVSILVDEDEAEAMLSVIGDDAALHRLSSDAPLESQLARLFTSGGYDAFFPLVYIGSRPDVKAFARKHRSIHVLELSPQELRTNHSQLLASASQRSRIPARYRCGG